MLWGDLIQDFSEIECVFVVGKIREFASPRSTGRQWPSRLKRTQGPIAQYDGRVSEMVAVRSYLIGSRTRFSSRVLKSVRGRGIPASEWLSG